MENEKLLKVSEVAQIIGLPHKKVQDMCHARGQRFALRLKPNGNWYIYLSKFKKYLEGRLQA